MPQPRNRNVPIFLTAALIGACLLGPASAHANTVTVTGTVDDPAATVTVNGMTATISGSTFTAANVPLTLGPNLITATATDPAGNSTQVAITVHLGVMGNVQGPCDDPAATVTVNGVTAAIAAGEFSAAVPLTLGLNTLTATATDPAGNVGTAEIDIFVVRPPVEHP